jgi:N-acetylglucosaminyldiphosphoundecaprenol N-acetyl-beta-D-mannosaminyltransferase
MNNMSTHNHIDILGVEISNYAKDKILCNIEKYVQEGNFHAIFTPNVDDIVKAKKDPEFMLALNSADMNVPDGMGIVFGSYILGTPFKEMIGGRRLVPEVCRLAEKKGWRIYLFGGKRGIANLAKRKLEVQFPGLSIVRAYSPSFNFMIEGEESDQVVQDIKSRSPEILFVGLGSPKGKKWIIKNKSRLKASVAMEVGGTFDILAGLRREPPAWVPNLGLEWLFRLFEQSSYVWRRYLIEDPVFFGWVLKKRLTRDRFIWS